MNHWLIALLALLISSSASDASQNIKESPVGPSVIGSPPTSCYGGNPHAITQRRMHIVLVRPNPTLTAEGALRAFRMQGARPLTCAELATYGPPFNRGTSLALIALDLSDRPSMPGRLDTSRVAALLPGGEIQTVPGTGTWGPGVVFLGVRLQVTERAAGNRSSFRI